MEEPEKTTTESETKRRRALRNKYQGGVIHLKLAEGQF
jgi:hypothetical protein